MQNNLMQCNINDPNWQRTVDNATKTVDIYGSSVSIFILFTILTKKIKLSQLLGGFCSLNGSWVKLFFCIKFTTKNCWQKKLTYSWSNNKMHLFGIFYSLNQSKSLNNRNCTITNNIMSWTLFWSKLSNSSGVEVFNIYLMIPNQQSFEKRIF